VRKMKAAELVLDFEIYPRNNVDGKHVRDIADARAAGVEMPPVIVEKKSHRVVDGFHRVKGEILFAGEDASVLVIEKTYRDEAALFLEAMSLNAAHGAKLDPCDRTRCAIIAERLSIPLDQVAGALHMPADKLGALRANRTATSPGGMTIPIKRTIRSHAGKRLTRRQVAANEKLSGMNQQFYANQLIELIEADLLDKDDQILTERLRVLHGLLGEVLAAH
jgi:hypothetical protein